MADRDGNQQFEPPTPEEDQSRIRRMADREGNIRQQ
jgi:hypothetical protein